MHRALHKKRIHTDQEVQLQAEPFNRFDVTYCAFTICASQFVAKIQDLPTNTLLTTQSKKLGLTKKFRKNYISNNDNFTWIMEYYSDFH